MIRKHTMRVFIAIDLGHEARAAIATEQKKVARRVGGPGIRFVQPEHLHVTLAFVDRLADAQVARLVADFSEAFPVPAFELVFGGHLAPAVGSRGWGAGVGASFINGGPYHIKLVGVDSSSIGNRDNQITAGALCVTYDVEVVVRSGQRAVPGLGHRAANPHRHSDGDHDSDTARRPLFRSCFAVAISWS